MSIKEMILESIQEQINALNECDCEDECKCDDKDLEEGNESDDEENPKKDKKSDDEEDLEEAYNFKSIKAGSTTVTPTNEEVKALEKLFKEIDLKEKSSLWEELTKDEESCNRIIKYAKTVV